MATSLIAGAVIIALYSSAGLGLQVHDQEPALNCIGTAEALMALPPIFVLHDIERYLGNESAVSGGPDLLFMVNTRNVGGILEAYSEDAVLAAPDCTTRVGHGEIAEWLQASVDRYHLQFWRVQAPRSNFFEGGTDVAAATGGAYVRIVDNRKEEPEILAYLRFSLIFGRRNGEWKILRQTWNHEPRNDLETVIRGR